MLRKQPYGNKRYKRRFLLYFSRQHGFYAVRRRVGSRFGGQGHYVKDLRRNGKKYPLFPVETSAKDYIDKMIWQINNKLIEISQSRKSLVFGTLVICAVCGDTIHIAAAGDSPAYFLHNNTAVRIAKPKKKYQNLIDLGLFSEEQLEEAVHRLPEHMWSMFDTFIPSVVPEYSYEEISLKDGDVIVLCCDGVSDCLSPEFIWENIAADNLPQSVDTLINTAKERSLGEKGYCDDLTMIANSH